MTTLSDLLPVAPVDTLSFRFGTVTQASPLRVKLDGDTAPLNLTPTSVASASMGSRVLVAIQGRQPIVVGVVV